MSKKNDSGNKSVTIDLLPTTLARISSLSHPILLLSAYYVQFPRLVLNPVDALLNFLLPVVVIQIIYVVLCLPRVGFTSSQTNIKSSGTSVISDINIAKAGPKKKKSKKNAAKTPASCVLTISLALILTGLAVPLLTIVQILFGAPFVSHLPQTLLSSAHLSLLSLFPLIYVHGTDSKKWRQILSVYCPLDEVFGATIGTFFGGWLGAIPIPLDWDREWQKWPVTIVTGMYLGHVVGKFLGGYVFKGKKIELD